MNTIDSLIQYFGSQRKLASVAHVTQPFISLAHAGKRKLGIEPCMRIESASDGFFRCEELRPDVDWAFLRGTATPPQKAA
jgi:DNA-binding transcriptional regulator YdaS (Cro superfamily)